MRKLNFISAFFCCLIWPTGLAAQTFDPGVMMDSANCNTPVALFPQETISACTRVINSSKANNVLRSSAYAKRGYQYALMGKINDAIADYDEAIGIKSDNEWAFANRSLAYLAKKELDLALVDIESAMSIDKKDLSQFAARARILSAMGHQQEAMQDTSRLLGARPGDPHGLLARGEIYLATGRTEQAMQDFQTALKNKPEEYVRVSLNRVIEGVELKRQMERNQESAKKQREEEARKLEAAKKQTGGSNPPVERPKNPFE